jgi:hypothetical protein
MLFHLYKRFRRLCRISVVADKASFSGMFAIVPINAKPVLAMDLLAVMRQ